MDERGHVIELYPCCGGHLFLKKSVFCTVIMSCVLLQLAGSSDPSTQSLSLSQTHTRGIQRLVMAHWNWLGAHVTSAVQETQQILH